MKALDISMSHECASNLDYQSNLNRSSTLERMPKWMICIPLTLQWLWLSLRYRSFTLPSAANPAITSGVLSAKW